METKDLINTLKIASAQNMGDITLQILLAMAAETLEELTSEESK